MHRTTQRHVPMHVAQELLEQRDALAAEVRRLRESQESTRELQRTLQAKADQVQALQARSSRLQEHVDHLSKEVRDLEELLAEASEPVPVPEPPDDSRTINLESRIEELEADLTRVHRRVDTETTSARREERVRLLSRLGEVLDSAELALRMNDAPGPWREGVEGIREQLIHFMEQNGAHLIGVVGEPLDPRIHEALAMVDDPQLDSGTVSQIHRHGIQLDDGTVARAAQVLVVR